MTAKTHNATKSEATKAKRTRKPRRQLPENKDDLYIGKGESPTLLDVVAGRGEALIIMKETKDTGDRY
jgi:hypothetical protein